MESYRENLVNEIKLIAKNDAISDREAFFQIYLEKLEEADLIEDYHYLFFSGTGSRNRNIQIDGYFYSELDNKLSLFIIPPLSYYNDTVLTASDALSFLKKPKFFFFDAEKVIEGAEESTEGYGIAYDIINKKMKVEVLEIIIITDMLKSPKINIIESEFYDNIRIDYSLYDISRMMALDDSKNGKEPLLIDLKKDFDCNGIPALSASTTTEYKAYLCNIPGVILAKLYDKYQSRLLEGNVRSFLQSKGKVNKGIRKTILNEPSMFFAYNNGIAATAESITLETTQQGLMITGFNGLQIVNGGQTTASLANSWTNDTRHNSKDQIEKIFVPMKLSVVSFENAQELIPNISRFANSQNKVSDADLASNHPFHIKIEELSRRIVAPAIGGAQFGTYWYYERANGQYRQETYKATKSARDNFELKNPKKQMFKKVDLAKYYNIYLQKPNIASAGAQKSFNMFNTWLIKKWDKDSNFVNENFYKEIIALAILFKQSDYIVRKQIWYDSYKANIVAYTLSSIFYSVEKNFPNHSIDFQQIWKNQNLSDAWMKQIQKVSKIMYNHLVNPNRTVENVTEWAKRQVCWDEAKNIEYDYNHDFINELIDKKYSQTQIYSDIKKEKMISEMDALVTVFDYGVDYWKKVYEWGCNEEIWNTQDISFLNLAMNIDTKVPTDKQAIKILQVLEKARIESFPQ